MNVNQQLEKYIKLILPRILTQVCRNKYSKNFGSFDRNWWHYKIRDFSSIILQQGAYTLSESIDFFNENETRREFMELLQPIKESIYNEIYIYLWVICFYSIMLFILILANLFMLLNILNYGKYIHNISGRID